MIGGIPFENTPDFEYVYEDTVKLPEFELYHMGLGMYRFEQPLNYGEEDFKLLTEKYSYLTFFYRIGKDHDVTLLFVMSKAYNITNFWSLSNALGNSEFAKMIPKGYDERIDKQRYMGIHWVNDRGYPEHIDTPNQLLGFRWMPEQYYDLYGRRRYIMIDGKVAKLIATGLYAFQGMQWNELWDEHLRGYPCVEGKIKSKEFHKCAVVGEMVCEGERYAAYLGTNVRYIAFDDIGINFLKRLYEYTVGYEYKDIKVVTEEEKPLDILTTVTGEVQPYNFHEMERKKEEKKNSYPIGANAIELIKGIGYRDIAIYCRVLFHIKRKEECHPRKYDFVYIEDGMLKLVNIREYCDIREYSIPVGILAELYVVKKTQLCFGVTEDILYKVIDNTCFEKNAIGTGNYDRFVSFVEHMENWML